MNDEMLSGELAQKCGALERGGRVRIELRNARAGEAVHVFLKFQISDHRTGDHTGVQ
jgi:hypothetical protein